MSINELQRIKNWHVAHKADHPLEYHLWDTVLTVWVLGWIGWVPVWALEQFWLAPVCPLGMLAPTLYVMLRQRAHAARRLRCEWLRD